jgi:hypothetical protein
MSCALMMRTVGVEPSVPRTDETFELRPSKADRCGLGARLGDRDGLKVFAGANALAVVLDRELAVFLAAVALDTACASSAILAYRCGAEAGCDDAPLHPADASSIKIHKGLT